MPLHDVDANISVQIEKEIRFIRKDVYEAFFNWFKVWKSDDVFFQAKPYISQDDWELIHPHADMVQWLGGVNEDQYDTDSELRERIEGIVDDLFDTGELRLEYGIMTGAELKNLFAMCSCNELRNTGQYDREYNGVAPMHADMARNDHNEAHQFINRLILGSESIQVSAPTFWGNREEQGRINVTNPYAILKSYASKQVEQLDRILQTNNHNPMMRKELIYYLNAFNENVILVIPQLSAYDETNDEWYAMWQQYRFVIPSAAAQWVYPPETVETQERQLYWEWRAPTYSYKCKTSYPQEMPSPAAGGFVRSTIYRERRKYVKCYRCTRKCLRENTAVCYVMGYENKSHCFICISDLTLGYSAKHQKFIMPSNTIVQNGNNIESVQALDELSQVMHNTVFADGHRFAPVRVSDDLRSRFFNNPMVRRNEQIWKPFKTVAADTRNSSRYRFTDITKWNVPDEAGHTFASTELPLEVRKYMKWVTGRAWSVQDAVDIYDPDTVALPNAASPVINGVEVFSNYLADTNTGTISMCNLPEEHPFYMAEDGAPYDHELEGQRLHLAPYSAYLTGDTLRYNTVVQPEDRVLNDQFWTDLLGTAFDDDSIIDRRFQNDLEWSEITTMQEVGRHFRQRPRWLEIDPSKLMNHDELQESRYRDVVFLKWFDDHPDYVPCRLSPAEDNSPFVGQGCNWTEEYHNERAMDDNVHDGYVHDYSWSNFYNFAHWAFVNIRRSRGYQRRRQVGNRGGTVETERHGIGGLMLDKQSHDFTFPIWLIADIPKRYNLKGKFDNNRLVKPIGQRFWASAELFKDVIDENRIGGGIMSPKDLGPYLGLELEIVGRRLVFDDEISEMEQVHKLLVEQFHPSYKKSDFVQTDTPQMVYRVRDGSVDNGSDWGHELVTQPMNLTAFQNTPQAFWDSLRDNYVAMFHEGDGRNYGNGIHIHVDHDHLTTAELWIVLQFIYMQQLQVTRGEIRWNQNLLGSIAQRPTGRWAHWYYPRQRGFEDLHDRIMLTAIRRRHDSQDKYDGLNLVKNNTLEFRYFNSTTVKEAVLRRLEFVDAVLGMAKYMSQVLDFVGDYDTDSGAKPDDRLRAFMREMDIADWNQMFWRYVLDTDDNRERYHNLISWGRNERLFDLDEVYTLPYAGMLVNADQLLRNQGEIRREIHGLVSAELLEMAAAIDEEGGTQ